MPNDVRVRVVLNRFPQLTAAMVANAETVVAATAVDLEAQMKVRAAVRTGFLRGSIQASKVGHLHWRVTVGADYGAHVNYGTVNQRAQPFLEPAVNVVRPAFHAAMRRVLS